MPKYPVKNPQVFFRVSPHDTIVLVDLDENDFFFEIEGLAADLWREIDGKKSWEEIKNIHRDNCELGPEDYEKASEEFLAELLSKKLITLA